MTDHAERLYRGGMWWTLAALWAASVALGWYIGRRTGDVDTEADGIGYPFILGPVGLVGWLLLARPMSREPRARQTPQPE